MEQPDRRSLQDAIAEELLEFGGKEKKDIITCIGRLTTKELHTMQHLLDRMIGEKERESRYKKLYSKPINEILEEWKQYVRDPQDASLDIDLSQIDTQSIPELVQLIANSKVHVH
jgi:uncharacterized protein YceH (UPF0502 family)